MTLYPLHTRERGPLGVLDLEAGVSVEGGQVGWLTSTTTAPLTALPQVSLFSDNAGPYGGTPGTLQKVGLIDDSSTGAGYGVTGHGTPLVPGVTESTGTPAGPATHYATGKVTFWMNEGLYATDVWDTSTAGLLLSDLTGAHAIPGTSLYVGAGAQLGNLTGTSGTDEVGCFVRRFVGGLGPVDDFDSWFIPRVQPKLAGDVFMVFKFK